MPVFSFSLAWFALLAVPALVAIYWLRNRAKERRVSSLLLWLDEKQRWDGGLRIHRLQTPLLFFLELLAILLLVVAAAKPMVRTGSAARPLVVVLDDSFSMQAGGDDSARGRAAKAIESELREGRYNPIRFVLAGETPQVLGETTASVEQARKTLQDWNCGAAAAKLEAAIAFAFELGGSRARVLVVTDHAPTQEVNDSRLQWWSFGSARPNLAFVNASRTARDGEDRVLLEIANLSSQSASTSLSIEMGGQSTSQPLTLGPNESRRITMDVKNGSAPNAALRAIIRDDVLDVDNDVVLLPEPIRVVRVDLQLKDARLRQLIEKAVQSVPQATLTAENPDLVISDDAAFAVPDAAWVLHVINEPGASSYLGPFVQDRAHPLTEGMSLGGVVWAAGKSPLPGTPVIIAGNLPLLTDVDRAGRHELRLRLRPELSTLQETPNWPILFWNLIAWRAGVLPGLQQANIRMGGEARLTVGPNVRTVGLTGPAHKSQRLPVQDKSVIIKADAAGVYELRANQHQYALAANALSREESDLTLARSGRWGNWANAPTLQWEYRSLVWLLLLLVLAVLALHSWAVARRPSS